LLMPHKKEINFAFNIPEHLSFMCQKIKSKKSS
jgi:hypothetical protein